MVDTTVKNRPSRWLWVLYQVALTAVLLAALPAPQINAHDQRGCCSINCYDPGVGTCPNPTCTTLHDSPQDMWDLNCVNCQCSTTFCHWRTQAGGDCQDCDVQPQWSCTYGTCPE